MILIVILSVILQFLIKHSQFFFLLILQNSDTQIKIDSYVLKGYVSKNTLRGN